MEVELPAANEEDVQQEVKHNNDVARGTKHTEKYTWCRSCQQSHTGGKRHHYSPRHREKLVRYLMEQAQNIKGCKFFLHNPKKVDSSMPPEKPWKCFACEVEIDNSKNSFICFETLKHLASKKHKRAVENFWVECGVFIKETQQALKKKKVKFCVSEQDYRQFLLKIKSYREEAEEAPPISSSIIASPHPSQGAVSDPKTVVSPAGILQNPSGWHNGMRVWGGGIVKYRNKKDWLPWPLDLESEHDDSAIAVMGGWSSSKQQQQQQEITATEGTTTTSLRYTAAASGANLTSIGPHTYAPGESNIHNGGVPPWLLDDKGNIKTHVLERLKKKDTRHPHKLGADLNREALRHKSFLPNFGGVWQMDMSRAETRAKFIEEEKNKEAEEPHEVVSIEADTSTIPKGYKNMSFSFSKIEKLFK